MPTAYVSGLMVTADTIVRKERLLPVAGEVLVTAGQESDAEQAVARALRPGNLATVKVSERLGIDPADVPAAMRRQQGDRVTAGEMIAETRGLFGLFHNLCEAPVAGTIEHISPLSGYVTLREEPAPLQVLAHISGRVERIVPQQGAVIATRCALVQGIFGVGGERRGTLQVAASGPDGRMNLALAGDAARGAVLIGGATADATTLAEAARAGAAGVIVGSLMDADLRAFVGYDIGVAVTGQEQVPFTLILTEGFGLVAMAAATFDLLSALAGKRASIDGATQIRAGVIRPEIVVPRDGATADAVTVHGDAETASQLAVGAQVRLIREPFFGRLARVTTLPPELRAIETEAQVRVVEVELPGGERVVVPRANVEMVHG